MTREQIRYFERRAEEEARRAAEASDETIRRTHSEFAMIYRERVAQTKAAYASVDELLG